MTHTDTLGNWTDASYEICNNQQTCNELYGSEITGLFGPLASCCGLDQSCDLFCFRSAETEYNGFSWANCLNVGIDDQDTQNNNCLIHSGNTVVNSCNSSPNSIISIYDMTGKLMHTENYHSGEFDCSSLADGIYLAVVQSETDRSVLKFAISR